MDRYCQPLPCALGEDPVPLEDTDVSALRGKAGVQDLRWPFFPIERHISLPSPRRGEVMVP